MASAMRSSCRRMPEEWLDMGEGGGGGGGGEGGGGGGGGGEEGKQKQQNREAVNRVQRQDNLATYLSPHSQLQNENTRPIRTWIK